MALDYSTAPATGLLAMIRDITYAGSSLRDWDDVKLIRLLNRMVEERLVPFIMAARKGHFDTFQDTPLVALDQSYPLPSKATGGKLRTLLIVDSSGNPYVGLRERDLEDGVQLGGTAGGPAPTGVPGVYWFQGNMVYLFPAPSGTPAGLSLRFHFLNRPSTLVATTACVQITALPGGSVVTVASGSIPTTGYTNGSAIDLVQNKPGFDVQFSGTISSQTATSITFNAAVPSTVAVGDWVCVSDTAPVVTGAIPEIVIGCLIRWCQLEILSGKSDDAAFKRANLMLSQAEKLALQFLNRRNTGDRPKFGIGSLHRFKRGGWFGGF